MQTYSFDETRAWEAVNHYREHFRVTDLYKSHVFNGIPELLEALVRRGHTLYVATSKPGVLIRKIARHFASDHHFRTICGSELDGIRTHKDKLVRHLLNSEGPATERCLMIDNRIHDLLDVDRNGVACIDVSYGFGSEDELCAHQPTHCCTDPAALRQVLESH